MKKDLEALESKMTVKKTKEKFIQDAIKIHGNKYCYNNVNYINTKTKVQIYCNTCGKFFLQTPEKHIGLKRGCPYCFGRYKTSDDIIKNLKKIYKSNFDYSKINYTKATIKICIICNKCCKTFFQTFNQLKKGKGCPYCNSLKKNNEKFIKEAKVVHKDKYNYSLVNYINRRTKVQIICNKCGKMFEQMPFKHLYGQGCPHCNISFGEQTIEKWLKNKNIRFETQKKFKDCKDIRVLPFDFYLPDYNMCIEYQGEQHYTPKMFILIKKDTNKGMAHYKKLKRHDHIKKNYCKQNNIKLLEIKYNNNIEEVLEYNLKSFGEC